MIATERTTLVRTGSRTDVGVSQPQAATPRMPRDAAHLSMLLTLRDGASVRVRAIRADDGQRLQTFHAQLSPDTVALRFFHAVPTLDEMTARHMTHVDYDTRMALVATVGAPRNERIIGFMSYDQITPGVAEIAAVIHDSWQRRGVAAILFQVLVSYARAHGMTTFAADVMASNQRARDLLTRAGFRPSGTGGTSDIAMRLDLSALP